MTGKNYEEFVEMTLAELFTLYDDFISSPDKDSKEFIFAIKQEILSRKGFQDLFGDIDEIKRVVAKLCEEQGINYFW